MVVDKKSLGGRVIIASLDAILGSIYAFFLYLWWCWVAVPLGAVEIPFTQVLIIVFAVSLVRGHS
jgi:hypothetical protein